MGGALLFIHWVVQCLFLTRASVRKRERIRAMNPPSPAHTHARTQTPFPLTTTLLLPPTSRWPCSLPQGTPLRQSTLTSIRARCSIGAGRCPTEGSRCARAHARVRVNPTVLSHIGTFARSLIKKKSSLES